MKSNLKVFDKLYTRNYQNKKILKIIKNDARNILKRIEGLGPRKGDRVLDVGCGVGIFGALVKEKYSCDVYGLDINKTAIASAINFKIKAQVADIENKWPFRSGYFDFITMIQVFEHLLNTDHALLEARRVLKKRGVLLITTPNLASWFNRLIFLFGFQPFFTEISLRDKTLGLKFTRRMTKNRDAVGHIRVFTLKGLLDFLEYYKFKTILVKGSSVSYLPIFMKPFDILFSKIPSLASDIIIFAKK